MSAEILEWTGITTLDIPVEKVIDSIPKDMKYLVVLGYESDGSFYAATNKGGIPEVLWILKKAERNLLEYEFELN